MYYAYKEGKESVTVFMLAVALILFHRIGIVDDYFFYFLIFMIIFLVSRYVHIEGKTVGMLIKTVDRYSYHIYLVHPVVLYFLKDCSWYIRGVLGLSGAFFFGWLSYQCVDKKVGALQSVRSRKKEVR